MLPFERLLAADELGVRLEIVGGLPLWEAHPLPKHQRSGPHSGDHYATPTPG